MRRFGESVGFGINLEERNRRGARELTGHNKERGRGKTSREGVKRPGMDGPRHLIASHRIASHGNGGMDDGRRCLFLGTKETRLASAIN